MKPSNFGHIISRGQEAYPVSLKQSRLVKMIVADEEVVWISKHIIDRGLAFSMTIPHSRYWGPQATRCNRKQNTFQLESCFTDH